MAVRAIEAIVRALKAFYASSSLFVTPSSRWGLGSGSTFSGSAGAHPSERVRVADQSGGGSSKNASQANDIQLRLLVRDAISELYRPANLQLILGCLFLTRIFLQDEEDELYFAGQKTAEETANSKGSIQQAEMVAGSKSLARTPSSMSISSDAANNRSAQARPNQSADSVHTVPQIDQTRLAGIAEIVCTIISTTLGSAPRGPGSSGDASAMSNERASSVSPLDEIDRRRGQVLDFVNDRDSPFFAAFGLNTFEGGASSSKLSADPAQSARAQYIEAEVKLTAQTSGDMEIGSASSTANEGGRGRSMAQVRLDADQADDGIRRPKDVSVSRSKSRKRRREEEGSVLERLIFLINVSTARVQEAALWAIAELVRGSADASVRFFKCQTPSGLLPTTMLLRLRTERSAAIRLAAFSSLAHIIKVHPFTSRTNSYVLSELVGLLSHSDDIRLQIQACFSLARFIADDTELQTTACESYGCMKKLAALLQSTTLAAASTEELEERRLRGSPGPDEMTIRLREAALTALAALTYEQDAIRRMLADMDSPAILPLVVPALGAAAVGVRVAACRLVRSFSRSVSILRTSLVDAGAANRLVALLKNDEEQDFVKTEVIATICNLALKFSPMKTFLIESGGLAKLIELAQREHDENIRLNALWAIKNVLFSSDTETKVTVTNALTFDFIAELAVDASPAIQEQALNIIRNLASSPSSREADIEMTLKGIGEERLFELLENIIWAGAKDAVLEHAAYVLVNIATGGEQHRKAIIDRPNLLDALLFFLVRFALRSAGLTLTSSFEHAETSTITHSRRGHLVRY